MAQGVRATTTRKALAGAVLASALVLAGCAQPDPGPTAAVNSELQLPADYSATGPGALVSATRLPTIDRRLLRVTSVAAHITYNSTSGVDGSAQVVSGSVFAPSGTPPEGGWPVIVFGHGTTGVLSDCAPSLSPNLLGAADAVRALVTLGYVMVVPASWCRSPRSAGSRSGCPRAARRHGRRTN